MVSGIPALAGRRAASVTAPLVLLGSLAGLAGCAIGLFASPTEIAQPWQIPGGAFHARVDALSAFFAAAVFLLAGAGALYAERYWPVSKSRAAYVRVFFGLMTGSLALMIVAANTILFLAAWEIVAITAFLLVTTDDENEDVRRAAWIYLAASHVATLALFASFALLHAATGTWEFVAIGKGSAAILWLALIAFGIKAGLMPFHVWLPGAHAAAPSHVSAVMSGVVIKMGIYGLFRLLSLFDSIPLSFAVTVLIAGIVSSIFGVAFALAQHDLKRLLAYHSIENIGIIVTGLGIGLIGQTQHMPVLQVLGYAGALLHVWNHGLFKALLFLSGGAAVHEVHTREIDRMGGLAHAMPFTSAAFLIGAAAITGLPPLNGFISEWFLYIAGFSTMTQRVSGPLLLVILAVPALALTGALALACFVKAYGAVFLGSPRTEAAAHAKEVALSMRMAMLPLIAGSFAIGLLPVLVAAPLRNAIDVATAHTMRGANIGPLLQPVQTISIITALAATFVIALLLVMTRRARWTGTWDCGYAAPTARMQYTSSSFARGLVGFFRWAMPPEVHAPRRFSLFPSAATFESHVPDTVLDRGLMPLLRRGAWTLGFARHIQHGRMQVYLIYIGLTVIALLAWSAA